MLIWQAAVSLASDRLFFWDTVAVAQTHKWAGSSGTVKRTIYLCMQKYAVQGKDIE